MIDFSVFLPQDVLYEAIVTNVVKLNEALVECCNTSMGAVTKAQVIYAIGAVTKAQVICTIVQWVPSPKLR